MVEPVEEDEFIIGKTMQITAPADDTNALCSISEYTGELVFPTSIDFNRQ